MTYLQLITSSDASDILRLTKRAQGLTIEAFECINGEFQNEETKTFYDAEKASEMVFNRSQDVYGTITFDY